MLSEAGISYTFDEKKAQACYATRFFYRRTLTAIDQSTLERVWIVGGVQDFLKLVNHWNRPNNSMIRYHAEV